MQHFILDTDLSTSKLRIEDKNLLHQMKEVLRFKVGNECMVLNGRGEKAKGVITELHRKGTIIELEKVESCPPPKRALRLYCALPKKPSTFELIVQKATELGVTDIVPLITDRTQVKEIRKAERLQLIMREAAEQSERCFLPSLHPILRLEKLLQSLPSGQTLAGEPWKYTTKLSAIQTPDDQDLNLIIGPEGGLSDDELEALKSAGVPLFLLGETVLRMETAVIAALSVVQFG